VSEIIAVSRLFVAQVGRRRVYIPNAAGGASSQGGVGGPA